MSIKTIKTEAYEDQAIASTGLRRRVEQFKRKAYLENIIQSVFDIHTLLSGNTIVIGGDGRFFNKQAIQTVLKMAAANGVARAIVGQHGLLSTPAASYIIRKYGAAGGFILTAGCNPGGKKGDFGIKLNLKCGGPSDDVLNEEIFQHSRTLKEYKIDKSSDVKLEKLGIYPLGTMQVEVIDPVMDYADLMQSIFDFPMLKQAFADGKIKLVADLINGVGGIYVEEIFIRRLGTPLDSFENLESKDTFSGKTISLTPDDLTHLVNKVVDTTPYHLLAVVDPDADRCLMFSDKCLLSSGDNLALLTQYSHLLKPYRDGLIGVARSYTTSQAVDGVAKSLKIPCYETPNGWQFFARLLESNLVNICGEAASAVGADHNREKDAIWSILFWLTMMAKTEKSMEQLLHELWNEHGRYYQGKLEYNDLTIGSAQSLMVSLRERLQKLVDVSFGPHEVRRAEDLVYHDPHSDKVLGQFGVRIWFKDHSKATFQLSNQQIGRMSLRIYCERYFKDADKHHFSGEKIFRSLFVAAQEIAEIDQRLKNIEPEIFFTN